MSIAGPAVLSGSATGEVVDLKALQAETDIDTPIAELERDLVGLAPVKQRIREIAAFLLVARAREQVGLVSGPPTLHMSFTGNPGTGKTTVALRMASILHKLGYVRKGHLVSVTRDDLVGQYIGHTAPKTKEVLKRAMGGVLFIDEAYYLHRPENEKDYGQEAIEILLQVMENQREDLVVILAGYRERMETFFSSNPGLPLAHCAPHRFSGLWRRRTARHRRGHRRGRPLPAEPGGARSRWPNTSRAGGSSRTSPMPARSATRSTARGCGRPCGSIKEGGAIDRDGLMTIEAADIKASRIFAG